MFRIIITSILLITIEVTAQLDSLVSYHNNSKIESIIHLRDNVRDGDASFYWENGNPKLKLTYINGRVEGLVREYYQNGALSEMFTIESGKREGPTSLFDSTGKYIKDIYYEDRRQPCPVSDPQSVGLIPWQDGFLKQYGWHNNTHRCLASGRLG